VDLADQQWAAVEHLLPLPEVREDGRGRPWRDPRDVLNGILWILRTVVPWADMPSRYPPYSTCFRRFQSWVEDEVLQRVLQTLADDLVERGNSTSPRPSLTAPTRVKKGGKLVRNSSRSCHQTRGDRRPSWSSCRVEWASARRSEWVKPGCQKLPRTAKPDGVSDTVLVDEPSQLRNRYTRGTLSSGIELSMSIGPNIPSDVRAWQALEVRFPAATAIGSHCRCSRRRRVRQPHLQLQRHQRPMQQQVRVLRAGARGTQLRQVRPQQCSRWRASMRRVDRSRA
jgi:transposase